MAAMSREQMIDEAVRKVYAEALARENRNGNAPGRPGAWDFNGAVSRAPLIRREFRRIQAREAA